MENEIKRYKALSVFDLFEITFGEEKSGYTRGEKLVPFHCHGDEFRIPASWPKGTEVECPILVCRKVTVI